MRGFCRLIFIAMFSFFLPILVKPQPENYIQLGMCGEPNWHPSGITQDFCKCNPKVVSCDFSSLKTTNKTTLELQSSWKLDSIERLCICNTPEDVQVVLKEYFIYQQWDIRRIDIYNIHGPLVIDSAFSKYFSGDLYLSNITFLREMFESEYFSNATKIGTSKPIELNYLSDFECCSKIQTPKFPTPTFYLKDAEVGHIYPGALQRVYPLFDRWKSLIFDNVKFNHIDFHGIYMSDDVDVSFSNCNFHNLRNHAIQLRNVSNFLMVHNIFHKSCDRLAVIDATLPPSNRVIFIQNQFENSPIFKLHSHQLGIWFNQFNIWDSDTFIYAYDEDIMIKSQENFHKISVEFNSVQEYKLKKDDFNFSFLKDKQLIFTNNVIAHCDCFHVDSNIVLPKILQTYDQRCRMTLCLLKLKDVRNDCHLPQPLLNNPDYVKLCRDNGIVLENHEFQNAEEIQHFLQNNVSLRIESKFMDKVFEHVNSPFRLGRTIATASTTSKSSRFVFTFINSKTKFLIMIIIFLVF